MAITFLQAKKRQRYLMIILAVVIIAILIVVWQSVFRGEGESELPVVPASAPITVEIDWPTLKDTKLEELQLFEAVSPFEDEIGRDNPFIPY